MPVAPTILTGLSDQQDLPALRQYEKRIRQRGAWDDDVDAAFHKRGVELARDYVIEFCDIDVDELGEAGRTLLNITAEYVAMKVRGGTNANRTLKPIRERGLLEAAEAAVIRGTPTEGNATLTEQGRVDLLYERVVVDFEHEFSPRAVWYSKQALGLDPGSDQPPADVGTLVQIRTLALVQWLRERAHANSGRIPPFENAEAAAAIGLGDMADYGRVQGNIQSRLDFACWRARLPPLGLTAIAPFARAWGMEGKGPTEDVRIMQRAAQRRRWQNADFDLVEQETYSLGGQAYLLWRREMETLEPAFKAWIRRMAADQAEGSDMTLDQGLEPLSAPPPMIELPEWPVDAWLLVLDARIRLGDTVPNDEVCAALVADLHHLGPMLGDSRLSGATSELVRTALLALRQRAENASAIADGDTDNRLVSDLLRDAETAPERLQATAAAIRALIGNLDAASIVSKLPDEPSEVVHLEGRLLSRIHRYRERSPELARHCKRLARERTGQLACEACGKDFVERYGDVAERVIECHHRQPLSLRTTQSETRPEDMALLCANCHRAIHALPTLPSVEQFKGVIAGQLASCASGSQR